MRHCAYHRRTNLATLERVSRGKQPPKTAQLKCETEGARIRYTTDGNTPNPASQEYVGGIALGLGPDGKAAQYVIKAVAMKPLMGDKDLRLRYMNMAQQHASSSLTPHAAHTGKVDGSADGADRQPPHGGG
jgi:hypothetical protein